MSKDTTSYPISKEYYPLLTHGISEEAPKIVEGIRAEVLSSPSNDLTQFDNLRITDKTSIPLPVPIVTINNEIICTECNLTTISGASKSGKSAFTSIILAGAISQTGNIDGLEGLNVKPNTSGKAVIHFDTEQARHKHQKNLITILDRCGFSNCPDYLLSYNIRALEISCYELMVLQICTAAFLKFKGLHLIVIDGIADFISDVNDPIQANAIVKFFEDLAIKFSCPIITIVHTNPGSDKERGHLGSQCQRKSESVISVKSEGDISFIEPKFLRMAGKGNIPTLQFTYDKEKGYHVGAGIKQSSNEAKVEQNKLIITSIISKVFSGQKSFTYSESVEAIKEASGKGTNKCKEWIVEAQQYGLIFKDTDNRYRLAV